MPLIPSTTLLYTHALSLLTISYFLLTTPLTLLTSTPILILGEAMHIRPASFQPSPSRLSKGLIALSSQSTELLGILGVILLSYATIELLFAPGLSISSTLHHQSPNTTTTSSSKRRTDRSQIGEELYALTASQSSHLNLAFLHIIAGGALCSWIYIFHSARSGPFLPKSASSGGGIGGQQLGDVLGNQVVFSAAFMDMLFWGYLWTVIREERREVLGRVERMKADAEEEDDED